MKATFYMRSGNVIAVRAIKDLRIKYTGEKITYLSVTRGGLLKRFTRRLMVESIDLSQIEAITIG